MNREVHVRICERLGVQFPGPTRQEETELSQTGLRRRGESRANRHREATVTAPLLDSTQNLVSESLYQRDSHQLA